MQVSVRGCLDFRPNLHGGVVRARKGGSTGLMILWVNSGIDGEFLIDYIRKQER